LVVDRRFPRCTTCSAQLPKDWLLTPEQEAKLEEIDRHARAEHGAVMQELTRETEPDLPMLTPDDDPDAQS
jgi:hypothetical protein